MNKAEREDANKALFGPKLRVRLRKLTMAKAPVTAKKGSRKKETSPRLVAIPDIPSISSPIRPSSPKIPSSSMQSTQSYLKIPGVPLPHLPPLPKFPAVSLPSLTSLPKFPTVTMPSMPSLPSIPEIEAILSTPFQFVASLWPSFMSPSNLMTYYSSEENSSSTQSEGESSGSRLRQYCSAQNLFNFSASSLRFPSALKLYELSLLKSFSSPETKDADESEQDELEGASRPKRRRSEENGLKSNDMTNDQMVKILNDFLSNCDCNAKTKLLQQFSEQPENSDKLHLHRSLSEESLCKICMESPMDCVLLECGHIVSCLQCGSLLKQCPICRQAVERVVRTFRS